MNRSRSAGERQLDQEEIAKGLLQRTEANYVHLAVQLRIADALETIAEVMARKVMN